MRRPGTRRDSPGLPPSRFWLLEGFERIPTPQDDLKRLETGKLIKAVRATIDPAYEFGTNDMGDHHLFWPGRRFVRKYPLQHRELAADFRSLHINQIRLPAIFHNYLHEVTEFPELPSVEVMEYTVDAAKVTERFYQSLQTYTQWERVARRQELIREGVIEPGLKEKIIEPAKIEARLREKDEQLLAYFENLYKLPPEFQLVDPDKPMPIIAKQVGRLAAPDGLVFTRDVALPTAA